MTLEADIAAALKRESQRSGQPLTRIVNETLRAGLAALKTSPAPRRYRLKTVPLGGVLPGVDLDRTLRLAEALEDEAIARKQEKRE